MGARATAREASESRSGWRRFAWLALGIVCVAAAATTAQEQPGVLGLWWGESLRESVAASSATVLATTHHPHYGSAVDLNRLPGMFGGELSRILYFGDDDHLLRVWVNFGVPGKKYWEANFELEDAIAKYHEVKGNASGESDLRGCEEPELRFVEEAGERRLDPSFARRRTVWSCEYQNGPTRVLVALRRLGDQQGQRYDVVYDARAWQAVRAYQNEHDPRLGF